MLVSRHLVVAPLYAHRTAFPPSVYATTALGGLVRSAQNPSDQSLVFGRAGVVKAAIATLAGLPKAQTYLLKRCDGWLYSLAALVRWLRP